MTVATAPQQADTVLARDYERLKPDILRTVRGKLAASGVRFDDSDLDGFYNQAWHGVHTKLAEGERVENVNGLLVTITQRRALDEFRALRAESRVDAEALLGHGVDPDFASQLDDHTRLRQFIEGMRVTDAETMDVVRMVGAIAMVPTEDPEQKQRLQSNQAQQRGIALPSSTSVD